MCDIKRTTLSMAELKQRPLCGHLLKGIADVWTDATIEPRSQDRIQKEQEEARTTLEACLKENQWQQAKLRREFEMVKEKHDYNQRRLESLYKLTNKFLQQTDKENVQKKLKWLEHSTRESLKSISKFSLAHVKCLAIKISMLERAEEELRKELGR